MLRSAIFSACVLALVAPAAGAQIAVGAGAQSCGQWLEARRGKSTAATLRENMMFCWVHGYLAGTAKSASSERMIEEIAGRMARGELPPDILVSDPQGKLLKIGQERFGTRSGWLFDSPDPDAIKAWLDKRCREHPLDSVFHAADMLVDDLEPSDRQTSHPSRKR